MIDGDTPYVRANVFERSESTGYALLEIMLCGRPSACPTSCAITCRIASHIWDSSIGSLRAPGFAAPVSSMMRLRYERRWLWYHTMSLSMISPVRGSAVLGPCALRVRLAAQRTTE